MSWYIESAHELQALANALQDELVRAGAAGGPLTREDLQALYHSITDPSPLWDLGALIDELIRRGFLLEASAAPGEEVQLIPDTEGPDQEVEGASA